MADFEKFKEKLLSNEKFYSSLTDRKITDKNNKHEKKTMKNYRNLYLKCDVFEMCYQTVVFEKFRNNSLKNYLLCPICYLRAPGLSCGGILQMKNIKFQLISDDDMYIFFEKSTRGGISYISNRYSKSQQ